MKTLVSFLSLLVPIVLGGCASKQAPEPKRDSGKPLAPRLEGLGTHEMDLTIASPDARLYFQQGIRLLYGFNHAEAIRSFEEAARLDPYCAMCFWGQAIAGGPNINRPMPNSQRSATYRAAQEALRRSGKVTLRERLFIEAAVARYEKVEEATGKAEGKAESSGSETSCAGGSADDRRKDLDQAYVAAMEKVHLAFPEDDDAAALYASAIMDSMPWDYWKGRGKPAPGTEKAQEVLEAVLARNPEHPGANHFYIHLMESVEPEKAIPAADRLRTLMPGAGHLVHMPSHVYIRVGRYADATKSNLDAMRADESYFSQCHAQGIYPAAYYPHNIHFLWAAATMEGRGTMAIDAAKQVVAKSGGGVDIRVQNLVVTPLHAYVRFKKWSDILAHPEPPADAHFVRVIWRYARVLALANTNGVDDAQSEYERLLEATRAADLAQVKLNRSPASEVVEIARSIAAAEVSAQRANFQQAISELERAIALEDGLTYFEPATWPHPVRQTLGSMLLRATQPERAIVAFEADLKIWPENGWSLSGLKAALAAQGKNNELLLVEARLAKAWPNAEGTSL